MLRRTIPALHLHILLLLAALFNAMAGVPLHEARHIREAVRSAQVASAAASGVQADAADEARMDAASGEQDKEETHATCAWCLTHALDAGLAMQRPARSHHPQNPTWPCRKAWPLSRPSGCAGRWQPEIPRQPNGPDASGPSQPAHFRTLHFLTH